MLNAKTKRSGFTIVELLIVVVVIAILAVITVVAYNGVRDRAIDSSLRSAISSVTQKLETHNVTHSAYPGNLDTIGVTDTDVVKYQYSGPAGENTFCLSVTSPQSTTKAYHSVNGSSNALDGVCEGHEGPEGGGGEETFSFARTVSSGGSLGLTISVGEEWDSIDISWTPQDGAKRYEVQSRNPTGINNSGIRNFNYRLTDTGGSQCYVGSSCTNDGTYTNSISSTTTSLTWTNKTTGVPASAGQIFEYRLRYQLLDNSYSDWEELHFGHPIQSGEDIASNLNFKVTPDSSYTSVVLSWNRVPSFTPNMNEVFYEVQSRNPTGINNSGIRNFNYRLTDTGGSQCYVGSSCTNDGTYTNSISSTTTSLTWTNKTTGVPSSVGQNFEYQIRVKVSGEKTYYTEWSDTVVASHPIQANEDIPSASNFTVKPNADYTVATLSWSQVPSFAPNMNEVFYEVQSRNPTGSNNNATRNFNYRQIIDGGGHCPVTCVVGTHTHAVPFDTTSLTWTNTSYGVPSSVGQSFEYQMRIRATGERTFYSNWSPVVTVTH